MSTSTTQRSTERGPAETVAHAFANLMNGHDPDAVDGFVAEDYVNHNAHVDDGREANRAFWTQWFAAFPDTEVTLDDVLVDGDRVAGRFTYRATFRGQFMGLPPTGRPVVMHSIDIWRVVDGMAVEHWDQLDEQAFFAQLTGEDASR
ncbi:ester cyclase [Streptomyces tauricus]